MLFWIGGRLVRTHENVFMEVFKRVLDLGEEKLRENEKVEKEKSLKVDT
jgi:hypothetical protein